MPYVAPTTVTPGVPIASALHNTLAADIIDHESRIGTATTTLNSLPYAKLAPSAKNYQVISVTGARSLGSSDADNTVLVSGASDCYFNVNKNVFVSGQTVNLFRGGTGKFIITPNDGPLINGSTTPSFYIYAYGYAQLICIGNDFLLVGNYSRSSNG
jgi:hypothetical protein